jgi:hypothetical protein
MNTKLEQINRPPGKPLTPQEKKEETIKKAKKLRAGNLNVKTIEK